MTEERYNVVYWRQDGYWSMYLRDVGARDAVVAAKRCVENLGLRGLATKVQIVDQGDFTVFLWEQGKGIVYPTEAERQKAREEREKNDQRA